MKKTAGRPPTEKEKRTKLVQFYLTQVDADRLAGIAKIGKFKGVSTLLTSLVEPIVQGGFSVQCAARSVNRIQKFMERNKEAKFKVTWQVLMDASRDLWAPAPPIPDDVEDLSQLEKDLSDLLRDVRAQIEKETNSK